MPVEGRGLGSGLMQEASEGAEIGQPSNSGKCSETADGVTRESEDGSRVSLLRAVRQDLNSTASGLSSKASVNVTENPAPAPAPAASGGGGGGALSPLSLVFLAGIFALRRRPLSLN
jgi:hypothetical protein